MKIDGVMELPERWQFHDYLDEGTKVIQSRIDCVLKQMVYRVISNISFGILPLIFITGGG